MPSDRPRPDCESIIAVVFVTLVANMSAAAAEEVLGKASDSYKAHLERVQTGQAQFVELWGKRDAGSAEFDALAQSRLMIDDFDRALRERPRKAVDHTARAHAVARLRLSDALSCLSASPGFSVLAAIRLPCFSGILSRFLATVSRLFACFLSALPGLRVGSGLGCAVSTAVTR